jgi:hypothetical protein
VGVVSLDASLMLIGLLIARGLGKAEKAAAAAAAGTDAD